MKKPTNTKKTVKKSTENTEVKKTSGWSKKGVGSPKSEVGSEKKEVGSPKLEVRKPAPTSRGKKPSKSTNKKSAKISKISEKQPTIKLPDFENIPQMKDFCVFTELNLLPNYILATKQKQTSFLEWITINANSAKNVENYQPKNNIELAKTMISSFSGNDKPTEDTPSTDVPDEMLSYGLCLEKYITESPSARIHGKFPKNELDHMINTAVKKYNYAVEHDEFGGFITMTNENGVKLRVPQNGYLPL